MRWHPGQHGGGVTGLLRSTSSVHLGGPFPVEALSWLLKVPGGIPAFPRLPGPGKRSLRTDAGHLVLGENDGFVVPLPGAALTPPVHAVSAHPQLVKINRAIIPPLTAT